MPNIRIHALAAALLVLALALPTASLAADGSRTLPTWEQLTTEQREALVAPIRQRWNDHPEKREHMLSHAERWQEMDPGQRERARRGADRWRKMDPEKREALRALYAHMGTLPEPEREALRTEWKQMTPEQRRARVKAHPAPPKAPEER